jgi:hypothetical protein
MSIGVYGQRRQAPMATGSGNEHRWQRAAAATGSGGNRQRRQPAAAEKGIGGNKHQWRWSLTTLQLQFNDAEQRSCRRRQPWTARQWI